MQQKSVQIIIIALILFVVWRLFSSPAHRSSEIVGTPVPDVSFTDLSGNSVRLSDYQGKVVMLDFWASWCAPCVSSMPRLVQLAKEFQDQPFVFVAANITESQEEVQSFLDRQPYTIEHVLIGDRHVGSTLGVRAFPQMFLIDKQGIIQDVHVGLNSTLLDTMKGKIQSLIDR